MLDLRVAPDLDQDLDLRVAPDLDQDPEPGRSWRC